MDFSRLNPGRTLLGAASSALMLVSLLFLPWYSLSGGPENVARDIHSSSYQADSFICGTGDLHCSGFETFPIDRWLLILAAVAPLILGWIVVRSNRLSYPPGEITMTAGLASMVLILYNGIIDKPGTGIAEAGVSLDYGYFLAVLGTIGIALTGFFRSQSDQRKTRKAPGTV
jgi:hypothetical protein